MIDDKSSNYRSYKLDFIHKVSNIVYLDYVKRVYQLVDVLT